MTAPTGKLKFAYETISNMESKIKNLEAKVLSQREMINSAVESVHNSHEDDCGYNVLCALGQNP